MWQETVVPGTVVAGRGNATRHLGDVAHELGELTGQQLFPGSLNVVLHWPLRLNEQTALTFDQARRLLWPASLEGRRVWLYRWRHAPLHVVEVLSELCLRDALQLIDGASVRIQIERGRIEAVDWPSRLVWSVIWLGRRRWCYSNDRYYYRTASWCRRYGATQGPPTRS